MRKLRPTPLFRYFTSIDPLESKIRNSASNTELVNLIKHNKLQWNACILTIRVAALNIQKSFQDTESLKSSHFNGILKRLEDSRSQLTFLDACDIVFLIRTLDSYKAKKVFSREFEKFVITKAADEVNNTQDKNTVIELYSNLAYLEKTTFRVNAKLVQILETNEGKFTVSELQKLIMSAFVSSRVYAKFTMLELVKYIEKMPVENFSTNELTMILNPLQLLDQRYSIGYKLITRIIDNLLLNISSLDYSDIGEILLFYSNTDHFSRDLLNESLIKLTDLLRTSPESLHKLALLHIHRYLGSIATRNIHIKYPQNLLEGLDKVSQRFLVNKDFGYMEIGRFLVSYSQLSPCLPPSFKSPLLELMANGQDGLWQIFAIQGLSKLDPSIPMHAIIKNPAKTHDSILNGTYNIKLDAVHCIISIKDYKQKPFLVELLQSLVSEIMSKINEWNEGKSFMSCWTTRRRYLINTPEMRQAVLKIMDTIDKNWEKNAGWWSLKLMIELFSEEPEIKERWVSILRNNIGNMYSSNVQQVFTDDFDTAHLPALINLVMLIPSDYNTIAHILSFPIKDLPDLYTKYAVELLNKTSPHLLTSPYFFISKWSVFTSVFTRGLSSEITRFIKLIPEALTEKKGKSSNNLSQLLLLLANYGHLDQKMATLLASTYRYPESQMDLDSLISVISLGEPTHKDLPELLERLLHVDENISLYNLPEKINAYLLVGFTGKNEREFLSKIKLRLANIKLTDPKNVVSLVEALNTPSEVHKNFLESVVQIAAETLEIRKNQLKPEVMMKALGVFAKKGFQDQNFYEKLEENVVGLEFSAEQYVKVLIGYAKLKRNNIFFNKICEKLARKVQDCLPYSEKILEILTIGEMGSDNLIALTKALQEKQINSK